MLPVNTTVTTKLTRTQQFSSIIWPTDFWKVIDPDQASKARLFAQSAAAKLNVKLVDMSFEECWNASPPTEDATSLPTFINPVCHCYSYLCIRVQGLIYTNRLPKSWRMMYTITARIFAFGIGICLGERRIKRFKMSESGKTLQYSTAKTPPLFLSLFFLLSYVDLILI